MLASVVSAAVRFKALLAALAAGLLVFGALTLRQMPSDVTPELASAPVLEVQTEALGLSAPEVEQYVTDPLENNLLAGIMGVWDIRSQSISGLSDVDLYFEPGTSLYNDRLLVEERLTNAFSLPNVSKPPVLIQPTSTNRRVLLIGLRSVSKNVGPLELSYLARWYVKPRLSGVPGVADVAIFGQRDRQIQVLVDPARLAANHVALSDVIDTAGNSQLVSPLSFLEGSAPGTGGFLDGPNQRLEIRPVLPLGNPRNVAAVPVAGKHLGQIAHVVLGHQPLIGDAVLSDHRGRTVSNGHALVLEVEKLPGASTLAVTNGLERALRELNLRGVKVDTSFFRPASYVEQGIDNLELGLLIAAGLGLLALGALLLQLRAVVIAAISVAVTAVSALLLLHALGYTFNPLVVLGLVIALSIAVDDAIVATYEVTKLAREHPAHEPFAPVIVELYSRLRATLGYAGLIALVCLAPVFVAKGLSATFVHPMVLSLGLVVIVSMLVSVTLAPALSLLLLSGGIPRRATPSLVRRATAGYERLLQRALGIPRGVLMAACLVGLGAVVAVPLLHEPSAPAFQDRNLIVSWRGPSGASLTEMDRITSRVVGELRSLPAVSDAAAILGRAVSADRIVDPSSGQILVSLRPGADYTSGVAAVRSIVEGTPGMAASVGTYESNADAGVLARPGHEVTVRIYGAELPTLQRLAGGVRRLMAHTGGLGRPRTELPAQEPGIEVAINDEQAVRHRVLPGDARRQASTLVEGLTVGNFFQSNAVFDVVVQGVPRIRQSVGDVRNLLIDTSNGGHVRLGQIAQVRTAQEPVDIQHQAYAPYLDVVAPATGDVGAVKSSIARRLRSLRYPLAYHAEVLGGTPEDATSHMAFLAYVLAAAIGILLLLQAAFQNWRLATITFCAAPLSLAGGVLVAAATGSLNSLGADAGLLGIYLFALHQGILQIAHIRRFQAMDGGPLTPGTVTRALTGRFVPQLGAVAVLAAVLIPFVAIGDVAGNEITHTAAAVMLGGLLTSTPLVALLLPAICLRLGPTEPLVLFDPLQEIDRRIPSPDRLTPVSGGGE